MRNFHILSKRFSQMARSRMMIGFLFLFILAFSFFSSAVEAFEGSTGSRRLHCVTIVTKLPENHRKVFEQLNRDFEKRGQPLVVLGMNKYDETKTTYRHRIKLEEFKLFLADKPDQDVVLFVDAFDVVRCKVDKEVDQDILSIYDSFQKSIVFGAETNCFPERELEPQYPEENRKKQFPYLNSGLFIGRIDSLKKYLEDIEDDIYCDQQFWSRKYIQNPNDIGLDFENQLFFNMFGIDASRFEITQPGNQVLFEGKRPYFAHASGSDKSILQLFEFPDAK